MTWREFTHWLAYLNIEPPNKGDNERTASLLAQLTNMSGRSLPKGKMVSADDFLGNQEKQQTMEEQIAFMKGMGK